MPLSQDPEARQRQLANLKPHAAMTHGARSGAVIREAAAEHLANLKRQLPSASDEELWVQASRMAQIQRLSAFIEERGLIRDQRKGTVYNAASMLAQLSSTFERQHAVLLERERATGPGAGEQLEAIVREYGKGGAS